MSDLAFPNIDVTKPLGTYRVSTIDDYERETRRWLRDCMMEISGYPNSSGLKIMTWTNDTRPQDPAVGVFGYNIDKDEIEYFDGTNWVSATHALPAIYDKARKDQNGNVIDTTYATKSALQALQTYVNTLPTQDTTYEGGTSAQLSAGTVTTNKVWTPKTLHDYIASAITTALTGQSSPIQSGSNWVKLPNNLMIKWGTIATETNTFDEYRTYYFSSSSAPAFTSKVFCVIINGNKFGQKITLTNFRYYPDGEQGPGDSQPYYYDYDGYWFAIGI